MITNTHPRAIPPPRNGGGTLFLHIIILYLCSVCAWGQSPQSEENDTTAHILNEITITATRNNATQGRDGTVHYNTSSLPAAMHTLGEADALNMMKSLPGVTTKGEYGAGLSVDGAEPSQTFIGIAGIPVWFPYRFGGIFSTFNNSHFAEATFRRNIHPAAINSHLGSYINFEPIRKVTTPSATANIGVLASSATIKTPAGKRLNIIASGRISYIDQLYGKLLKDHTTDISYRFADINFTANIDLGRLGTMSVDLLYDRDKLGTFDSNYAMNLGLRWHNTVGAATWSVSRHTYTATHKLYHSAFANRLTVAMPQMAINLDSDTRQTGLCGDWTLTTASPLIDKIEAGYRLTASEMHPQKINVIGYGSSTAHTDLRQKAADITAYADIAMPLADRLHLSAGIAAGYFHSQSNGAVYGRINASPRVTVTVTTTAGTWRLHGGIYNQPYHQTGFSETGLASDFILAATKRLPVQHAASVALDHYRFIEPGGLKITAGVYYKRVNSQPEYNGQLIDLLDSHYTATNHIEESDGYNTGCNVAVRKETGRVTGHIGYSYGSARRKYDGSTHTQRGLTDPGHSLDATAAWHTSQRLTLGINFTCRSGRVYTPVDAVYVIADNLVCEYGERNSARLPLYHRLDITAAYNFTSRIGRHRLKQTLNLSLINAYGRRNIEMQSFVLNPDDGQYKLHRMASLYRFLPSLSYTVEF